MLKRLLIGVAATLALASVVLLWLSAGGAFVAAITAPLASAIGLISLCLGALLINRRVAPAVRGILAAVTVVFAVSAVLAHTRLLARHRDAAERPAKENLIGRRAPSLEWSHTFNMPAHPASPLPVAGRVAILDFWATRCSPCRQHMPKLEELHRQRHSDGLDVVGVTTFYGRDGSPEGRRAELRDIEAFLRLHRITYPVLVADNDRNHETYFASALPSSVLVDGSGTIIDYGTGIDGSKALVARATAILNERRREEPR